MSVADAIPINWRIISHPLNWVIIFAMLFIAGLGAHFAVRLVAKSAAAE